MRLFRCLILSHFSVTFSNYVTLFCRTFMSHIFSINAFIWDFSQPNIATFLCLTFCHTFCHTFLSHFLSHFFVCHTFIEAKSLGCDSLLMQVSWNRDASSLPCERAGRRPATPAGRWRGSEATEWGGRDMSLEVSETLLPYVPGGGLWVNCEIRCKSLGTGMRQAFRSKWPAEGRSLPLLADEGAKRSSGGV